MPTYEYECNRCGHRFELFQSISDAPKKRCPQCRGKVSRLLGTGAGIIFKGSGFYATDYRSDTYKKAAEAEASGGEGGKSSAKKDGSTSDTGRKKTSAKKESSSKKDSTGSKDADQ